IQIEGVTAQSPREIPTALQEEYGLTEEEARKRIAQRKIGEHEKAVGRDSLQNVDLVIHVSSAKFVFMAPAHPGKRAGYVIGTLIRVPGPGNRIADGSVATHLHERRAKRCVQRRSVGETKASRVGVIQVLVDQKLVSKKREAQSSKQLWIERVRLLRDKILQPLI